MVAAAPAEEERLPPPAALRASQEIANRNFCDDDDDDDDDDDASGSFAESEGLVREALCGRAEPPPAPLAHFASVRFEGPSTARSEALSEATTARAPSRESSPRDAPGLTVSFDEPPPRHRPRSGRPPRPVTAEAVSRALRRARGGYEDDDGASDDEEGDASDPVAVADSGASGASDDADDDDSVRSPDAVVVERLIDDSDPVAVAEIPSFAARFPFAPGSPTEELTSRPRPSTAGPGAGRVPTFARAAARRPATAGAGRRRRSFEDTLACLRAPLDLSLCDFLDDLVNLCDAANDAETRRRRTSGADLINLPRVTSPLVRYKPDEPLCDRNAFHTS